MEGSLGFSPAIFTEETPLDAARDRSQKSEKPGKIQDLPPPEKDPNLAKLLEKFLDQHEHGA